jgi:hypothetical protein
MDFSLLQAGLIRLLAALNSAIHNGYDGLAKAKPRHQVGMAGRDFAAVMTQTARLPAYRVFVPHIRSTRHLLRGRL